MSLLSCPRQILGVPPTERIANKRTNGASDQQSGDTNDDVGHLNKRQRLLKSGHTPHQAGRYFNQPLPASQGKEQPLTGITTTKAASAATFGTSDPASFMPFDTQTTQVGTTSFETIKENEICGYPHLSSSGLIHN